jgi:phage tail sheath protein FI
MNDRAASTSTGGGAASAYVPTGFAGIQNGSGKTNNTVFSYRKAAEIMTDPMASNINILAIPGIRDPLVVDHAADKTKDYAMAAFFMDLEKYDDNTTRLFDDSSNKPNARQTWEQFDSRAIDNNYVATYFPDVVIEDDINNKHVSVPASVAIMGAVAFNDKVGYPWFAPAGFNRASLDFVKNVDVRLNSNDRNFLYDARINPIATFPRQGYVIFGQKTLQYAKSALDRVNVRRLMIDIKRSIITAAERLVFEANTPQTRSRFVREVTPLLAAVQTNAGIEDFRVIMDETNNTQQDVEANRLNGQIIVVPVRTAEFIAMDFIITNSGVSFGE